MIRWSGFTSGYGSPLWEASNIELEPNKTYALLGPNGAGKSTLLKCIAGVKEDYNGKIELFSSNGSESNHWKSLKGLSSSDSQSMIAWMPTHLDIQNWKVIDFLKTNYQSRWDWSERLTESFANELNSLCEFVEIEDILQQELDTLSDGQKQRVMLAKALGQNTNILLLDEPVSFIDLPHKYEFMKKLNELSHQCIIYSSHDIKLSLKFSDEILFIYQQQIYKIHPSDFLEHPLVQEWLGSSRELI